MKVMQYFPTGLVLVIIFLDNARALPAEPVCSKFDYEMKTLEAMLRIENRAEKMMEEFKSVRDSLAKELDEIKNLKAEVERQQTAMESNFTSLKSDTESQKTAMDSKFTALKSEVEEKTKPDEVIAFSVKTPTKELVNGVPIFKTTIINIGNGYDIETGIFTCPVGGLYMFVFALASAGNYNVYCYIKHNGIVQVLAQSSSDNRDTSASASVNLLLQKGDLVTLGNCGNWDKVRITYSHTTFSGALIKRTG